jgi:hypothetical protein
MYGLEAGKAMDALSLGAVGRFHSSSFFIKFEKPPKIHLTEQMKMHAFMGNNGK